VTALFVEIRVLVGVYCHLIIDYITNA
jgi:hypothetical protein